MPGSPQPPSLNLPALVENLTAARTDDEVRLNWTMPKRTMDKVSLKRPIPAEICRQLESGPCKVIANIVGEPGKPASYTDNLPPDLTSGPLRLLAYQVRLLNHAQKAAGSSNSAYSVAGVSPPAVAGLAAQVLQDGVLLSWHPAANAAAGKEISTVFRIQRVLMTPANVEQGGKPAQSGNAAKVPVNITLAVHVANGDDPGHALDTNAQLNQQYRYTMQRIETVSLAGHSIELQGQSSDPVVVVTTDVFPPEAPKNVVAVADAAAGAIDVSWSPNTEPDLAGYYVYRRDTNTSLPAQRIGPPRTPIPSPSYRDTKIERGHTYGYSISAVDQNGNESLRSPEVVETLPNQ